MNLKKYKWSTKNISYLTPTQKSTDLKFFLEKLHESDIPNFKNKFK